MSSVDDQATTTRRGHAEGSRGALLDAAIALFDERGYEAATVRDIGERAGVDPALIARHFGGKEGLYLKAIAHPDRPPLPADAHELTRRMLDKPEGHRTTPISRALVDHAPSDEVREQVRAIIEARVAGPLAADLAERGVPDARLRAEILVAMTIGISLLRANGMLEEIAGRPLEDILRVLEPVLDGLAPQG